MATPLTVQQAAAKLGIGRSRVQQLIQAGRLPAQKVGIQYLIDAADLAKVKERKPGRPPSAKAKPAKRGTAGKTVAARADQSDQSMRDTLRSAGVPMPTAKRKRK